MTSIPTHWLRLLLLGFGQVMFRCNIVSGFLFVAGLCVAAICLGSPSLAAGPLAGCAAATLAGSLLFGRAGGEDGSWGFNGALIGCAMAALPLDADTALLWCVLIAGAAISPVVKHLLDRVLLRIGRTSLTMPFVLITWAAILILGTNTPAGISAMPPSSAATALAASLLKGISEVFLMDSTIVGAIFIAALAADSLRAALLALAGALAGFIVASLTGAAPEAIYNGLYGFSPALTAIAVGSSFKRADIAAVMYTALACVATVIIQLLLEFAGIPPLTAPFCIATWAARR